MAILQWLRGRRVSHGRSLLKRPANFEPPGIVAGC
jgi:hypothetical protein